MKERVRLVAVREALRIRVPFETAAELVGDIGEMREASRAMPLFKRAEDGGIAVNAAVHEVTDYVPRRALRRAIVEKRLLEDILLRFEGVYGVVELLALRRKYLPTLLVCEDRSVARGKLKFYW